VKSPEVLVVIPARGGSKSIPRKNIKRLNGHPLIAYSIAAGVNAETVSRVIVSTDDSEIAEVALRYGAEVPFIRPVEIATDLVQDLPVFTHALDWLEKNEGYKPEIIVQLRPTSPIRPLSCVDDGVRSLLETPDADCVRGVIPSGQNPYKMWRLESGRLIPLMKGEFDEPYNMPRQELPATYWQTGHIDAIRYSTIREKNSLTGDLVLPLIIEPSYAVDIDTIDQWEMAEMILRRQKLPVVKPEAKAAFPKRIGLVVFDFDGVMTDDRVFVDETGRETVACSRGDGMGLDLLKKMGVPVVVISKETNPVVEARCRKIGIPCHTSVDHKVRVFETVVNELGLSFEDVIYVGNDVNDIDCIKLAGCGVAVSDAHDEVLSIAEVVLSKPGGRGAVRELCDLILSALRTGGSND